MSTPKAYTEEEIKKILSEIEIETVQGDYVIIKFKEEAE